MLKQNENEKKCNKKKETKIIQIFNRFQFTNGNACRRRKLRHFGSFSLWLCFLSGILTRLNVLHYWQGWIGCSASIAHLGSADLASKNVGPLQQVPNQRRQKIFPKNNACEGRTFIAQLEIVQVSTTLFSHSFFLSGVLKSPKKIFESRQIYFYSTTHNP